MGVILALLIASGELGPNAEVPLWVVLSAHTAIALGTLDGRLAHREDDGHQADAPPAGGRHVRRVGRRRHAVLHVRRRHPGIDDPHDHRRNRGRGREPAASPPCGGVWRGGSCGRGCSRFREPPSSPACRTWSWTRSDGQAGALLPRRSGRVRGAHPGDTQRVPLVRCRAWRSSTRCSRSRRGSTTGRENRDVAPGSAEPPGDVALGAGIARSGEQLLGVVELDQPADPAALRRRPRP